MMENGGSKSGNEPSYMEMTIKIEVEAEPTSTAHIDSETDLNQLKQEPGLVQYVKSEPTFLVEILDDSSQDSSSGPYMCECCLKAFHNKSELVSHLLCMARSKKKFERQLYLPNHAAQVRVGEEHKRESHRCDKCLKVFECKNYLTNHCKRVHCTESHKCTQCNKGFKCKKYLIQHVQNTHNEEHYKCDVCTKMYKSQSALCKHVSTVHRRTAGSPSGLYMCECCLKEFNSRSGLVSHIQYMARTRKNFEHQQYLSNHTEQVHGGEEHKLESYRCDKCLKVFECKNYFWNHCKRVHGTETHKCTQCNKEFKCKKYLRQHVQNTHNEERYKCEFCMKMYKSRSALCKHVSTVHRMLAGSSSGSYMCECCLKEFHSRSELVSHILNMARSKKKFEPQLHLSSHTEQVHDGVAHKYESYRCDECPRVFKYKNYLLNHLILAHATESHKCTQCVKEFKCKKYLLQHVKNTHNEEQYECDICKKIYKSRPTLYKHVLIVHRRFADGNEGTPTPAGTDSVNKACGTSLGDMLNVKHELGDMDIGPTVLQHMDIHNTVNKNMRAFIEENTTNSAE